MAQQEVMRLNASLEQRVARAHRRSCEESNRALSVAKAAADEANRAKSQFLATMSHEIRTPMNGVIGMIDVLHQTSLNGHQVEMVDLIRESAFSLLDDHRRHPRLLEDRGRPAGARDARRCRSRRWSRTSAACSTTWRSKKDVELTVFVDPAIPDTVLGDATRLRQVLVNLVSNAIKFSSGREQPGRVVGAGRCWSQRRAGLHGRHRTSPTTASASTRQTRGAAVHRRSRRPTPRPPGASAAPGSGWRSRASWCSLMGGEIALQSEPGTGSTFSVRLPLARSCRAAQRSTDPAPESPGCAAWSSAVRTALAADLARLSRRRRAHSSSGRRTLAQLAAIVAGCRPGHGSGSSTAGSPSRQRALRALARSCPNAKSASSRIGRGPRAANRTRSRRTWSRWTAMCSRRRRLLQGDRAGRPDAARHPRPAPRRRNRLRRSRRPPREEARRTGRLILVAEDNETNQKVILRQLALLGFRRRRRRRTAGRRWSAGASGDYALVLTDLHMPAHGRLRARPRRSARSERGAPAHADPGVDRQCARGRGGALPRRRHGRLPEQAAAARRPEGGAGALAAAAGTGLGRAAARAAMAPPGRWSTSRCWQGLVGDDPAVVLDFLQDFRAAPARSRRRCARRAPPPTCRASAPRRTS